MTELGFQAARWALLLPAALLAAVLLRRVRRRPYLATNLDALGVDLARPSPVRRAPAALLAGALGLLALALMDPVVPLGESRVVARGLDIVIVLDLSASMQEVIGQPRPQASLANLTYGPSPAPMTLRPRGRTRLEATREVLREFVRGRRDDRLGLVVFSDHAYVVSPLTMDRESLLHYIDLVDEGILRGEGMTAIGEGLALGNHLLDRQRAKEPRGQVVLLLTDGEHNLGRDPLEPLTESQAAGIRVHLVGIDLEEDVKEKPAVRALVAAVEEHGGRYLEADDERALRAAARELDALEKGRLTTRAYERDAPAFAPFALGASGLAVLALALLAIPYFSDLT